MAQVHGNRLTGPLFDEESDLLAIAEELLDLPSNASMPLHREETHRFATQLIMLDVARSLRKIASGTALHTTYRSQYSSH